MLVSPTMRCGRLPSRSDVNIWAYCESVLLTSFVGCTIYIYIEYIFTHYQRLVSFGFDSFTQVYHHISHMIKFQFIIYAPQWTRNMIFTYESKSQFIMGYSLVIKRASWEIPHRGSFNGENNLETFRGFSTATFDYRGIVVWNRLSSKRSPKWDGTWSNMIHGGKYIWVNYIMSIIWILPPFGHLGMISLK